MVKVWGRDEAGNRILVDRDQCVRGDATMESLAALKPAFMPEGGITAGNSSQVSDGAAALLLASPEKAAELGLKPRARFSARSCPCPSMGTS